jgi:hypothetical protein
LPPRLDHYIARPVTQVVEYGEEDWEWGVELVGDVVIKNHDKRRTAKPDGLVDLPLMMVTFGELDTEMHFGVGDGDNTTKVTLTPTQYSISDGHRDTGDEPYYPQVDPENIGLPDDPSADRVAEGPEVQEDEIVEE